MITLTVIIVALLILALVIAVVGGLIGGAILLVFGDLIIAILIIVGIRKLFKFFKRKKIKE